MADRWLAYYACRYCKNAYKSLNIATKQLGMCPCCFNYNTPKYIVRVLRKSVSNHELRLENINV